MSSNVKKGSRVRDSVKPVTIGFSPPSKRDKLQSSTLRLVTRSLHTLGTERGYDKDWFTKAETLSRKLVLGEPFGSITFPPELREIVRNCLSVACEQTGYTLPPRPRRPARRK